MAKKGKKGKYFIVAAMVRAYLKKKKAKASEDFLKALNKKIPELLDAAVARAKANRRVILKPQDL